jgi:hypothetical protein
MNSKSTCIAVFKSHVEADSAVKALQRSGYDMKKLSIVAREFNTEEKVIGYYNAGDRMKYWGTQGAFWGGLWGMLVGSAFFWIPGVGPIVVAGPILTWIVGAIEGAVVFGSLSVVGAGLCSLGVQKDSVIAYEASLSAGKYLLIAIGSPAETYKAKEIIKKTEAESTEQHIHEMKALHRDSIATTEHMSHL